MTHTGREETWKGIYMERGHIRTGDIHEITRRRNRKIKNDNNNDIISKKKLIIIIDCLIIN